jgi:hypothetical protein
MSGSSQFQFSVSDPWGDIQNLLYDSGYSGSVTVQTSGDNVSVTGSQGDATIVISPTSSSSSRSGAATGSDVLNLSPQASAELSRLQVALALITPSSQSHEQQTSDSTNSGTHKQTTDQQISSTGTSDAVSAPSGTIDLLQTIQNIEQSFIQSVNNDPNAYLHAGIDPLPGGAEGLMSALAGTTPAESSITISEFGTQYYQLAQQEVSSFADAYNSGNYTVQSAYQIPGLNYGEDMTLEAQSGTDYGFVSSASFDAWAQQQDVANNTYSAILNGTYVTWADPDAAAQSAAGFNLLA